MRSALVFAVAFLLGFPAEGATATGVPAPATALPVSENALRLSRLVNPTDRMLEAGMKGFDVGIEAELKRSPEGASEYVRNPGLLEAIRDAGRAVMRKHLLAMIPSQQRRFASFYAEKFSPVEIDQLIAFYSSPTGAKALDAIYSGIDLETLSRQRAGAASKAVTAEQLEQFNRTASAQVADRLDAEDWKVLLTFSASPVRQKLMQVAPEFNQLVAEVENEPDPELDREMGAAIKEAVARYKAKGSRPSGL